MVTILFQRKLYTKSFEIINSKSIAVNKLPSRASYELKTGDIITAVAGNAIETHKQALSNIEDFLELGKGNCL